MTTDIRPATLASTADARTTLISALNWRYAAKRMNHRQVADDVIDTIVDAAHLAPSSFGLQPYSVLVVSDPALRARLHQQAIPQPQVTEGSHLLVFATWDQLGDRQVDELIQLTADTRQIPVTELDDYSQIIKATVNGFDSDQARHQWAARQAYLGLGLALTAAAMARVDATPMEGFDPAALDQALGLTGRGLRSVVVMTVGYRNPEADYLAEQAKVRWPRERFRIDLDDRLSV